MGFDAPEIVWSQCQSQLQNELPEQQYNTWIRPLKLKYFDADNERFNDPSNDDVIELLAPNRFVEDWVKSKFLNRIEELFHQLSGNGVVLGISASPANAPQYKQQSEFVSSPSNSETSSTDTPSIIQTPSNLDAAPVEAPAIIRSAAETSLRTNLNNEFTFDSFVEGKSNQLAFAAAQQVAENPGGSYLSLIHI